MFRAEHLLGASQRHAEPIFNLTTSVNREDFNGGAYCVLCGEACLQRGYIDYIERGGIKYHKHCGDEIHRMVGPGPDRIIQCVNGLLAVGRRFVYTICWHGYYDIGRSAHVPLPTMRILFSYLTDIRSKQTTLDSSFNRMKKSEEVAAERLTIEAFLDPCRVLLNALVARAESTAIRVRAGTHAGAVPPIVDGRVVPSVDDLVKLGADIPPLLPKWGSFFTKMKGPKFLRPNRDAYSPIVRQMMQFLTFMAHGEHYDHQNQEDIKQFATLMKAPCTLLVHPIRPPQEKTARWAPLPSRRLPPSSSSSSGPSGAPQETEERRETYAIVSSSGCDSSLAPCAIEHSRLSSPADTVSSRKKKKADAARTATLDVAARFRRISSTRGNRYSDVEAAAKRARQQIEGAKKKKSALFSTGSQALSAREFDGMCEQLAALKDHSERALQHLEGNFSGVWAPFSTTTVPEEGEEEEGEICIRDVVSPSTSDSFTRTGAFLAQFGACVTASMNTVAKHGVDLMRMHAQLAACVPKARRTGRKRRAPSSSSSTAKSVDDGGVSTAATGNRGVGKEIE